MKKISLLAILCFSILTVKAQEGLNGLLRAGVENAERFSNDFLKPGTNGVVHSLNANWFNTADVKPLGGFEISIITNAAVVKNEHRAFQMNIADYNQDDYDFTVEFEDGANSKMVSTVLGENNPDIDIIVRSKSSSLLSDRITLPSGVGGDLDYVPSAFIQGALGLSKGLEVKARFLPKIKADDIEGSMFGAALQAEFTKWLPADKVLPVALSGLVAYTTLDARYDLTESSGVDGQNQRLENNTDTWLFQFIASTKLPIINFYGGIGYISGESKSDVLGTYIVNNGILPSEPIDDPFSVSSKVSSVRGTLGTKLKLGFFRLNAEYHLSDYNAFSVGINFGFR
ncbi:hypothetical protein KFZ70_08785 [Tamlana fucoidanivorans]|uniref:PorT family protein n=1 Tax=Allotamlana fucoidanivorans TaxID=2583814 RepID=A0A5C4SQ58_9FLAO|nr:DUF6588 family protein [Tamlana fucoidanivorans]TNJ46143.1 hypothetical protein FGF67_03895 [Tamlana fucoidanivorans]